MTWSRITKQFNQRKMGSNDKKFSLNSFLFIVNKANVLSITYFTEIKTKQENSVILMKIDKDDDN